jgi:hypothetical protein
MAFDLPAFAFTDFAVLARHDQERAVFLLQALLLDEKACPLRIAWLRQAVRHARRRFPDLPCRGRPAFLVKVLAAVDSPGLIAAWRAGRVDFTELEALTRAPRALYEAHCTLLGLDPASWPDGEDDLVTALDELIETIPVGSEAASPVSWPTRGETAMSGLLSREEYERFRERLQHYPLLAELLAAVEMDPALDRQLLRFILDRCRQRQPGGGAPAGADAVDLVLYWLGEFVREHREDVAVHLDRDQFAAVVRRAVVRHHLESPGGEEPFQAAFREAALEALRQQFRSAHETLEALKAIHVGVPADLEPDYREYRRSKLVRIIPALQWADSVWRLAS